MAAKDPEFVAHKTIDHASQITQQIGQVNIYGHSTQGPKQHKGYCRVEHADQSEADEA